MPIITDMNHNIEIQHSLIPGTPADPVHKVAIVNLNGRKVCAQLRADFTAPSNDNNQTPVIHSWGFDFTNAKRQRVCQTGFTTVQDAANAAAIELNKQGFSLFR